MQIELLDNNFLPVCIVEIFDSVIWTDKFNGHGTLELMTPYETGLFVTAKNEYYLVNSLSKKAMIIEDRELDSSVETGVDVPIKGRTLESLLCRRIVWNQTILTGSFQEAIRRLLTENFISPAIPERTMPNFVFKASTDPRILALTVSAQYTGDNVYDAIVALCAEKKVGFKIELDEANHFVFELIIGEDRSYDQVKNPPVVFSPSFDNLLSSKYVEITSTLKNVALVAGEGEGAARRTSVIGTATGLDRRELFVDARDISSTTDDVPVPDAEYIKQLNQRGSENLAENISTKTFEGEVDNNKMYTFGEEFFLGDVVQIINEFGLEVKAEVSEVVISKDASGFTMLPTFTTKA